MGVGILRSGLEEGTGCDDEGEECECVDGEDARGDGVVLIECFFEGGTILAFFCEFPVLLEVVIHSGSEAEYLITDCHEEDGECGDANEVGDARELDFFGEDLQACDCGDDNDGDELNHVGDEEYLEHDFTTRDFVMIFYGDGGESGQVDVE